jgi:Na+/proline symporter
MGCGILTTYPQIAAIVGVQGLIVYSVSSALPIMLFAFAGPAIRRRCPDGFVLTEWVRHRFGLLTSLYLSFFTIITMFLYMVAELGAVQLAIESLTGLNALPFLILECGVTTIYTSLGGFHTSFFTDNIQGIMVFLLLIVCSIAMGTQIHIDTSLIGPSGLLNGSQLGYQLIYILPVAIATNDCFLAGFWLRTFASRSDRDLMIACAIATVIILIFLTLVGVTGLLAVWANLLGDVVEDSANSFFLVLLQLPAWVVGFVLVFTVALSTATFDSLQSAMASSISNDIFHNRLPIIYVRIMVILMMVPSIVVALRAPNILQIYLISDLISAAVVPVLFLGLSKRFYFLTGWEVIISGLGGILSVFIFGTIFFGNALQGAQLILLEEGLYVDDWSAFGAFVAAPVGGILFGVATLVVRLLVLYIRSRVKGIPFTALEKPTNLNEPFAATALPVQTGESAEELISPGKAVQKAVTKITTWRVGKNDDIE